MLPKVVRPASYGLVAFSAVLFCIKACEEIIALRILNGPQVQVCAKGAKFSMFKPAEEMVYIGLDEESRTKGKAAIDVVGAQSGKSAGSILQQAGPLLACLQTTSALNMCTETNAFVSLGVMTASS